MRRFIAAWKAKRAERQRRAELRFKDALQEWYLHKASRKETEDRLARAAAFGALANAIVLDQQEEVLLRKELDAARWGVRHMPETERRSLEDAASELHDKWILRQREAGHGP